MGFGKKIVSLLWKADNLIYLEYSMLALVVLLPLLKPGYVFGLDMIFTPIIRMPREITAYYPFGVVLHLTSYIIPSYVIQKVLMFLVLVLSGAGMHRLVPTKQEWPKYFGGILYVINPFVFQRFTAGQLGILEAYALTPFLVKVILDFLDQANLKRAVVIAILTSAVFAFSFHNGVFIVLFGAIALGVFVTYNLKKPKKILPVLKWACIAIVIFIIANMFWLMPFLEGRMSSSQVMSSFSKKDIIGFQSVSDPKLGLLFNVAAMYGFWGERSERFIPPKHAFPGWYVVFVLILLIVLWGLVAGLKKRERRWQTTTFGVVGVLSFVLAVGVAHPWFAPIFWFLVREVPFFKGFRDSQKFVALLVLSYGWLGALGVEDILRRLESAKRSFKDGPMIAPAIFLIIPLIYTYPILWGFSGHLKVTPDYPKDWYQVNKLLNRDKSNFKVLFLPWHQYMNYSFIGKVVANPARDFFDKPVIQGENIEFGPIYTEVSNKTSTYIEKKVVKAGPKVTNIGKRLVPLRVKYIVFAKEADFKKYYYLDYQNDLELIVDTETLTIYLNKAFEEKDK